MISNAYSSYNSMARLVTSSSPCLPPEVLSLIFTHLEWKDILQLRPVRVISPPAIGLFLTTFLPADLQSIFASFTGSRNLEESLSQTIRVIPPSNTSFQAYRQIRSRGT